MMDFLLAGSLPMLELTLCMYLFTALMIDVENWNNLFSFSVSQTHERVPKMVVSHGS